MIGFGIAGALLFVYNSLTLRFIFLPMLRLPKLYLKVIFLILLLSASTRSSAQLLGNENKEAAAEAPKDSIGRDTPRGTVNGFIQAITDRKYAHAGNYLKLKKSQMRPVERERIVKNFQNLLDRSGSLLPNALISNKPGGRVDEEVSANQDIVGTVTIGSETVNLVVENYQPDNVPAVWLFSEETVKAVANAQLGEDTAVDSMLPQVLKDKMFAGVPLGHWLAAIVFIVLSYILAWALVLLGLAIVRGVWKKARVEPRRSIVQAFGLPFRLYLAVWFFVALSQQMGISIIIRQRFSAITVTVGIIAILILLWRLTDSISTYSRNKMSRRGRISAVSVILFLRRTAKVALILIGIIAILSAVGVDVETYMAALGIGGIAIALGAQKTIENFVGSVALVSDQPLRVGDFCKIGDISGTVEQIGMRSTRLRTGERTVVTIPNGDLSASRIENFAHRDRFLFDPVFEFRPETTPDQIRFLLVELRSILYSHPQVNPEPAKIRFTEITTSSVKLEVYAYIEAPNFDTFQEIQEDILLRMMDVVEQSGTAFATPVQTVHLSRDKGILEEKSAEIAAKIKEWKDTEQLQVPKFDPDKIQEIKESIKYPDEGSSAARRIREAKKESE